MKTNYYLVIDFEATCCDQGSVPREQMEIIEFGAVMVEATHFQVLSQFQSFVRPVRHPELTSFCKDLTSIRQHDVDGAPLFKDVAAQFKKWLHQYQGFVFCSWGDYDRKQLQQDCAFHRIPNPVGAPHINLKPLMSERLNLSKKLGLGQALRQAGMQFEGTAHRGIDDARNIARLLPLLFDTANH